MSQQIEIHLPYFKQGDDMAHFLENKPGNPQLALHQHAAMLVETAAFLNQAAEIMGRYDADSIHIQGDSHFITVEGPDVMCLELMKTGFCAPLSSAQDYEEGDENSPLVRRH